MNRLKKFESMRDHAWFGRNFAKLSVKEIAFAQSWIIAHDHLNQDDFQLAANRMGLDDPTFRATMKNFERVQELISNSNLKEGEN